MKKYVGWDALPEFLQDCAAASQEDVLVSPSTAAAILGYAHVSMRRLIDQGNIMAWAWYDGQKFHPSELAVSVHSLVEYGLQRGRLGAYENEVPVQAVLDKSSYEKLRRIS